LIDKFDRMIKGRWIDELAAWTIEEAIAIQQIPAPTFDEKRRAEYVLSLFKGFDLEQVEMDEFYNVYGLLRGSKSGAHAVMVSAHTDTVFPENTDLSIRRAGDLIYGPGLGDNCMGVAGVLALVSALRHEAITPGCDLWIVAPTREEGLGDLGGMRAAFARLKPLISNVINVEGLAFGHVYHAGIAVRRLKITAHTTGGHSWLHFGKPSAIHTLIQLGARIIAKQVSQTPRTTYNIGLIEGGQSINSIATEASFWLDMRSEDSKALAAFEQSVRADIAALTNAEVAFTVEVVGDRPSGSVAVNHPLVVRALEALAQVGVHGSLETGSTDGNVPLSEGCPTVTVGITRGGNAHRLDEYVEVSPVTPGIRQLIMLTLATADMSSSS
jgi:acetylornithine deacetylase/succinyl-diaminopimelate desuccinylase-like protein